MTYTRVFELLTKLAGRAIKSSRFVSLAMVATFTSVAMQPAQAQSADTWKSIAIVGGSTAAGAYVGHKVAVEQLDCVGYAFDLLGLGLERPEKKWVDLRQCSCSAAGS